mmetsp:Transcript_5667/g.8596  ORF Transcript_5667/g.8596 Transcript_5667/m.8596 type:complete len:270 (-) Transcript_5667:993-1802(-)
MPTRARAAPPPCAGGGGTGVCRRRSCRARRSSSAYSGVLRRRRFARFPRPTHRRRLPPPPSPPPPPASRVRTGTSFRRRSGRATARALSRPRAVRTTSPARVSRPVSCRDPTCPAPIPTIRARAVSPPPSTRARAGVRGVGRASRRPTTTTTATTTTTSRCLLFPRSAARAGVGHRPPRPRRTPRRPRNRSALPRGMTTNRRRWRIHRGGPAGIFRVPLLEAAAVDRPRRHRRRCKYHDASPIILELEGHVGPLRACTIRREVLTSTLS